MVVPDSQGLALPDHLVVSDTSPLINLAGVGLLDLLQGLYGTIWVPDAVNREYMEGIRSGEPNLEDFPWIRIAPPVAAQPELPPDLGEGEVQAISLALATNARALLLDERLARSAAVKLNLPVVGTPGVLVTAKQHGLLDTVKSVIDTMIAQGRHISTNLYTQVLAAANELEES